MRIQKTDNHYIDNKLFSKCAHEYAELYREAIRSGYPEPRIPEFIGECFIKLASRKASAGNFWQYTFKDEMILDGIEDCVKAIKNFDISKKTRSNSPNAFGYFSLIIHNAFLRRIEKEAKQKRIKEKYLMNASISAFLGEEDGETDLSYLEERARHRYEMEN